MRGTRTTAIVLKTRDYSESSLVVRCFSREFGQLTGLARGVRRLRRYRAGALDLLCISELVLQRRPRSGLDLIHDAQLIHPFAALDLPYTQCLAGHALAEALLQLTVAGLPEPGLFDSAVRTLRNLHERELLLFLWQLVQQAGHAPSLETCARCGRRLRIQGGAMRFCFGTGGFLCENCPPLGPPALHLSAGTVLTLQQLATGLDHIRQKLRVTGRVRTELWNLTLRFLESLAERPLVALRGYLERVVGRNVVTTPPGVIPHATMRT